VLANNRVKNVSVNLSFCLQRSCKKCLQLCDSAGFNALYYVLFCLFLSTCVLQRVCVHTMDFVSAHKQINQIKIKTCKIFSAKILMQQTFSAYN